MKGKAKGRSIRLAVQWPQTVRDLNVGKQDGVSRLTWPFSLPIIPPHSSEIEVGGEGRVLLNELFTSP